jgi:hypothetical protein
VSDNIDGIGQGIAATEKAASRVLAAADQIGKQTASLRAEVDKFLTDVLAAWPMAGTGKRRRLRSECSENRRESLAAVSQAQRPCF